MSLKSLVSKIVVLVKKEPVAFWGLLAGAALNVAAPLLHLHAGQIEAVSTGLTLVGIPVVRSKVTPAQLASAAIKGVEAKKQA